MQSRKSLQGLWCRARVAAGLVLLLTTTTSCGGSSNGNAPQDHRGPAPINTLAYVDTTCRDGADGFSMTQELRVRRGENAPLTIARVPMVGPLQVPVTYCGALASPRFGPLFLAIGAFQRLGVSPDGSVIVFEVTDDSSLLGRSLVPPEQKGIFRIRRDGSDRQRLGNASRVPAIVTGLGRTESVFYFSPGGRLVSFTDMGPGPDGQDAAQVFILDIETGERTQVTHLPSAPLGDEGLNSAAAGPFLNDRIVAFDSSSNPEGRNPEAKDLLFTVDVVTRQITLESTIEVPGGGLVPVPGITGFGRVAFPAVVPGVPVNQVGNGISELFIADGTNVLQLTNFRRSDTSGPSVPFVSADGARAFFIASADPFGMNPLEVCQVFSVNALGGDLRQLTRFSASQRSALGCVALGRPLEGCTNVFNDDQRVNQDPYSGTVVFSSSCDPFESNPDGVQIFAMHADGSGLRALTDARGLMRNPDGSVEAEVPGPWSYGPHR